jgi:hypothetical protein
VLEQVNIEHNNMHQNLGTTKDENIPKNNNNLAFFIETMEISRELIK